MTPIPRVTEHRWPRTRCKETLSIFTADGRPFRNSVELARRAEQADQRAEQAEERAKRLVECRRALGIDPDAAD